MNKFFSNYLLQAVLLICVFTVHSSHSADQSIDFAAQAQQESAQQALNTVKKLSREIQSLKSSVVCVFGYRSIFHPGKH